MPFYLDRMPDEGDTLYLNGLKNTSRDYGFSDDMQQYVGQLVTIAEYDDWNDDGVYIAEDHLEYLWHFADFGDEQMPQPKRMEEIYPDWWAKACDKSGFRGGYSCEYFIYVEREGKPYTWKTLVRDMGEVYNLTLEEKDAFHQKYSQQDWRGWTPKNENTVVYQNNNTACFAGFNSGYLRVFNATEQRADTMMMRIPMGADTWVNPEGYVKSGPYQRVNLTWKDIKTYIECCIQGGALPKMNVKKMFEGFSDDTPAARLPSYIYLSFSLLEISNYMMYFFGSVIRNIAEHPQVIYSVVQIYEHSKMEPLMCYVLGHSIKEMYSFGHSNMDSDHIKRDNGRGVDPLKLLTHTLRVRKFLTKDPMPKLGESEFPLVEWRLNRLLSGESAVCVSGYVGNTAADMKKKRKKLGAVAEEFDFTPDYLNVEQVSLTKVKLTKCTHRKQYKEN
jgi:hypothetical protein